MYELETTDGRKTDEAATIAFEITDRNMSLPPPKQDYSELYKRAKGVLSINRSTNACSFELSAWNGKTVSGRVECVDPVFYFNPWSWFPQTTKLFYTRAFYAIHTRPTKVE